MSFLAMAQWQAWLVLGLAASAILVIFFLRIRHREVLVSSSLLWERVLERRRRRSWVELLRRLISLLIALLIGLSLVLSFTEAEWGGAGPTGREVALVIDTSLGMAALTAEGESRFERARKLARGLLTGGSGADTFVLYDTGGRVVTPATSDRAAVIAALDRLRPHSGSFRFPALQEGTEAWLISDGVAAVGVPAQVKYLSVFEPADNVGISAFEIRPTPTDPFRHEAFLEVGNFSGSVKSVQIVLQDENQVQFRRTVQLRPNQFYQNTFDLAPLEGGTLQARVQSDGDALGVDDRAWVHLPSQGPVRVLLVSERPSAVGAALGAEQHVELELMSRLQYEQWHRGITSAGTGAMAAPVAADPVRFHGMIFEGIAPDQPPPVPALLIGPPSVEWLPAQGGSVLEPEDPNVLQVGPLFDRVDLHDLHVEVATRVAPGPARVLVGSRQTPLVVAGEALAPWVMMTFQLQRSDFPQSLGFAIFVGNLVQWFRGEADVLRATPGRVSIPHAGALVVSPGGELVETRALSGSTIFDAPSPGVYQARAGGRTIPIIVGATDRRHSAINQQRLTREPARLEDLARGRVLWPILLPLVALLLVIEGLTYHRRITV